jgi:hypothetical protein
LISIDKAKQLKELGLEWEPQGGDFYFYPNGEFSGTFTLKVDPHVYPGKHMDCQTWLPRLDQLLIEIRKYVGCALYVFNSGINVLEKGAYEIEIVIKDNNKCFRAHTSEDAAANTLIYILENQS